MASKEQCDRYAEELAQRFEDFTKWAVAHWPREDFPLLQSDFNQSRRELGQIIGAKLGDGDDGSDEALPQTPHGRSDAGQYRDMNPMPWP